jgi:hypothetical protein
MIMNVSVQAALAFSGQINPIPIDGAWKGEEWKLYTVYTVWIAFEFLIVYIFYVETRYVAPLPPMSYTMHSITVTSALSINADNMAQQRPNSRRNRQNL